MFSINKRIKLLLLLCVTVMFAGWFLYGSFAILTDKRVDGTKRVQANNPNVYEPGDMFYQNGTKLGEPLRKDVYINMHMEQTTTTNYQGENTYLYQGHWIKKPTFHSGSIAYFYLFGASVTNYSQTSSWDELRIYGQWHLNYSSKYQSQVKCCIKYSDGSLEQTSNYTKWGSTNTVISRFYYVFPVNRRDALLPVAVSISFGDLNCHSSSLPYVEPVYPWKQPGKLGISPKVAYGTLASENVIEWLETMKYLGVDKVIIYADESLNSDALNTLHYYESTGLVDVFPYYQPAKDLVPRDPSMKGSQQFADAKVVIFDAYERLRGYTYFALLDFDEFLIPGNNRSLKTLMEIWPMIIKESLWDLDESLFGISMPNRCGFKLDYRLPMLGDENVINNTRKAVTGVHFKTKFFITSWGKVNVSSDLELGQYLNTTEFAPDFDRRKAITLTEGVQMYKNSHDVITKPGYTMLKCSENDAFIRHYRSCRNEWKGCKDTYKRVTTLSMAEWANANIASNVRKVRQKIFGITRLP